MQSQLQALFSDQGLWICFYKSFICTCVCEEMDGALGLRCCRGERGAAAETVHREADQE